MQIRLATRTDLDAIEALWREMMDFQAACDDYFIMSPQAEVRHQVYMSGLIQDDDQRVFVTDYDGQLLGFLNAEINAFPPIYPHQNYGHIDSLLVTKSDRHKGVERRLMEAALAWFHENGLHRVECAVAVENPLSQGFWKGLRLRPFIETHVLE
jgi:ribosomal protein S18 acetylase RimI-like enzyme